MTDRTCRKWARIEQERKQICTHAMNLTCSAHTGLSMRWPPSCTNTETGYIHKCAVKNRPSIKAWTYAANTTRNFSENIHTVQAVVHPSNTRYQYTPPEREEQQPATSKWQKRNRNRTKRNRIKEIKHKKHWTNSDKQLFMHIYYTNFLRAVTICFGVLGQSLDATIVIQSKTENTIIR